MRLDGVGVGRSVSLGEICSLEGRGHVKAHGKICAWMLSVESNWLRCNCHNKFQSSQRPGCSSQPSLGENIEVRFVKERKEGAGS